MSKTQQQVEEIIRKNGREPFYSYYLSLGYNHKTAACLALFTYGRYRFRSLSMDQLYESLAEGKELGIGWVLTPNPLLIPQCDSTPPYGGGAGERLWV